MFKMSAKEHRAAARAALSGRWGLAIAAGLVATAIMGGMSFSFSFPANFENESFYESFNYLSTEEIIAVIAIMVSVFTVIFLIAFPLPSKMPLNSPLLVANLLSPSHSMLVARIL